MPTQPRIDLDTLKAAYNRLGSMRAVAAELGIGATNVRRHLNRVLKDQGKRTKLPFTTDLTGSAPSEVLAAERGELGFEPVLPGYAIKRTTTRYDKNGDVAGEYVTQAKAPGRLAEIPAGHVLKGVSNLKDGQGRVTQEWLKTREGQDPVAIVDAIKAAFEGYRGRYETIPAPVAAAQDLLT